MNRREFITAIAVIPLAGKIPLVHKSRVTATGTLVLVQEASNRFRRVCMLMPRNWGKSFILTTRQQLLAQIKSWPNERR